MVTEQEYKNLQDRLKRLEERRVYLLAQEKVKQERRDKLLLELKAEGVDTEHLDQELSRLEAEETGLYQTAKAAADKLEQEIQNAERGSL